MFAYPFQFDENTMTTWFADKTFFPLIKTAPTPLLTKFCIGNPYLYPTLFQNFQPYFCHTSSQECSSLIWLYVHKD